MKIFENKELIDHFELIFLTEINQELTFDYLIKEFKIYNEALLNYNGAPMNERGIRKIISELKKSRPDLMFIRIEDGYKLTTDKKEYINSLNKEIEAKENYLSNNFPFGEKAERVISRIEELKLRVDEISKINT